MKYKIAAIAIILLAATVIGGCIFFIDERAFSIYVMIAGVIIIALTSIIFKL
jgi:hypothetical protein